MKIDIYSGFLGAGKTTLIKKMMQEAYRGEKLVLIENEFGEIGIDGGFLQEAGIQITEMNSGCICCSLVGDFGKALQQVMEQYAPDRIVIEPSGVGKLSDVIAAVRKADVHGAQLGSAVAVADASKVRLYMKNFGEFYNNQLETANLIFLSRTDSVSDEKIAQAVAMIRERNPKATIVTTPWGQLTGAQILDAMEHQGGLDDELHHLEEETACPTCGGHHHEHHHHDHDEHCGCGHEHHDHEKSCACDHEHQEHHHHDEPCGCGHDHHEHHQHEEHCGCGHDHGNHHADEVFASWGVETPKKYSRQQLEEILEALEDENNYGMILRAKGYVAAQDGGWIHFDYVPGEPEIRAGGANVTGRICVIGSQLNQSAIAALFSA